MIFRKKAKTKKKATQKKTQKKKKKWRKRKRKKRENVQAVCVVHCLIHIEFLWTYWPSNFRTKTLAWRNTDLTSELLYNNAIWQRICQDVNLPLSLLSKSAHERWLLFHSDTISSAFPFWCIGVFHWNVWRL